MPSPLANPLPQGLWDCSVGCAGYSTPRVGHTLENRPENRYTAFTAHFVAYWRTTATSHQSLLLQA